MIRAIGAIRGQNRSLATVGEIDHNPVVQSVPISRLAFALKIVEDINTRRCSALQLDDDHPVAVPPYFLPSDL